MKLDLSGFEASKINSALRHSQETKVNPAKPRAATKTEKKPSVQKWKILSSKASGEAQPARWQNPLNRSPRAKICNSSVCKWEAPGLKCVWTPCAIVPLNFVGVSGSRTHVIKARNWLWNSVLPLLCSQISGQTPLLSCATSMQKYFGQDGNDYCQRQGLICEGKCQKIPSTEHGEYT